MSVDECIDAYQKLSGRVFNKTKFKVSWKGDIQGQFDAEELKQAAIDIIEARGLSADALLKDATDSKCKV